jgi:6-phosphogluconolactonase
MATIQFNSFNNFAELIEALVTEWLSVIDKEVRAGRSASFALAGGSTPAPIYRRLDQRLMSSPVTGMKLVATDERWVDDSDAQSNEGLFKQCLSLTYQKQWQLISLKNAAPAPEAAVDAISERLDRQLPQSFSAVLLGMGTDGHIASLFPGAPTQLDDYSCLAALHPQTGQSRMSLSLPRLLETKKIWLVITGAEKRQVLETALMGHLPIAALIREAPCDVEVFWCP